MEKASNKDITLLRKLKLRKHREKEEMFIVEGERAVFQVLMNRIIEVQKVFIEERLLPIFADYPEFHQLIHVLSYDDLQHVFDTESPQGVLAFCTIPKPTKLEDLLMHDGLIVAFDRIQDPGNAGTMIRTAAWFGAKGVIISKGSVDIFNPKVVRSTAGATGCIPYLSGELPEIFETAERSGWKVILLDGNSGATSLTEYKPGERVILVIGNEANGIDPALKTEERKRVCIDGQEQHHVESLNAAIALGIALFELDRYF